MTIWRLDELPEQARSAVGGKARVLALLRQAGYPVPAGFVITPDAFEDGQLRTSTWIQVQNEVSAQRHNHSSNFAVRSSAVGEDSATVSFAGEFETVLNVKTDEELKQAIHTVFASRESDRVTAYAQAQGLAAGQGRDPEDVAMAVIVQEMVPAELAGVLFTADPVSGSQVHMTGNFVHGLGEQLVSGEVDAEAFTLKRPSGSYDGPDELRPYARKLFKLSQRLVNDLNGPQDIEWAVAGNKLFVLQSRPITTMQAYDPVTGEWNDSRRGDYLWSSANFGEALPGVMTPLTWSLVQIYAEETFDVPLPGDDQLMGNIGGRFYMNLSLAASMLRALGFSRERINRESEELFGNLPDDVQIPFVPFSRWAVLRRFLPFTIRAVIRRRRNLRHLADFTTELPGRVARLRSSIEAATSPQMLAQLWSDEFEPLLRRSYQMLQAGTSKYENAYRPLHRELMERLGEEDANLLLSGVSEGEDRLASLGPMLGLWQVAQGELSREDYLDRYGHRGLNEFEVSWSRPVEDPDWLDKQLASSAGIDVPALLVRREEEKRVAWDRLVGQYPKEVDKIKKRLQKTAADAREREAIRSAITRLFYVERIFALRAGELTGLDEGVFFLWLEELTTLLRGDDAALKHIPVRRGAHERLSTLPPYPALISGRFDPYAWAADPKRRSDIYPYRLEPDQANLAQTGRFILGLPGSAGVVEGIVRRLDRLDEGHLLRPGEILVTNTTNVGWTPLFPRAAAVVTDVGAPLSHAAIVARELGLPAVVGTGQATMRLRTGDRVRVNGTKGTVELLDRPADSPG